MTAPGRQIAQAVARFEDFHGFAPGAHDVGAVVQNGPGAGLKVGRLTGVIYRAIGENKPYIHRFRPKSAPELAVSHDGKQGYIVGGSYEFTGHGFEDRPAKKGNDMAGELLIINPLSKKRTRRTMRRMSAKQAKYFGKGRRRHHRRARRVVTLQTNPRPYRRARAALSGRSGLGGLSTSGIMGAVIPAAIGAAGAYGIDMLWAQLPVPDAIASGIPAGIAKAALSIGVGIAAGMVLGKRTGALIAAGGVTVALYNTISEVAGDAGGAGAPDTGSAALNKYISQRRGNRRLARYVSGGGMGYTGAGLVRSAV